MHKRLNIVAAVGLALGAVFGLAGTLVTEPHLQATLWGIDSVGLVIATSLLSMKFARQRNDFIAAGFLVFALGESVMLSGTAAGLVGSVPSFAAGTALWAAALLLVSIPTEFVVWVRLLGVATSILFVITSARIYWGEALLPTASPLPFYAYPFLVLTFIAWIWTLLREASDDDLKRGTEQPVRQESDAREPRTRAKIAKQPNASTRRITRHRV